MLAAFPAAQVQLTARLGVLSLGNNKGTHHEKSEDSGCARAARRRRRRTPRCHPPGLSRTTTISGASVSRPRIRRFRRASTMPRTTAGTSAPGPATSTSATRTSTTKLTCTRLLGRRRDGLGWDVGLVYYAYPDESDFDYYEAYGGITYQWFDTSSGTRTTSAAIPRTETRPGSMSKPMPFPLPGNFSFLLHAG